MTDLLKCPFCGGEASIYEEIPGGYIVQCHDCCGQIGIMTREHVIAAWNARAERTCRNLDHDPCWFECSECKCTCSVDYWGGGLGIPNHCPNCGARVVG